MKSFLFFLWTTILTTATCFVVPRTITTSSHPVTLLKSSINEPAYLFSPSSLDHLKNTELEDDYSRPWTKTKVQALATALATGTVLGAAGEFVIQNLLDVEKSFVLWGGLGTALGWFLGGGQQVAQDEKPINGGYDRKLIADRPERLRSVLKVLEERNKQVQTRNQKDLSLAKTFAEKVHTREYLSQLETKCQSADRPERLSPTYSRTLIDQYSYDAALQAASDWMASVDAALQGRFPVFALVRPPSHHACQGKGMGGCLLNSAAIAATYALEQPGVQSVAILDVDAHHGNGIAHCIEANPAIRYCSLHEDLSSAFLGRSPNDPDDPRSPSTNDRGPLGNILNVNLPPSTTWENGYRAALEEKALPFLLEAKPDLLLVAAGFDALEADLTSKLMLQPDDFESMAAILKDNFGERVACGLEGGYCWQNGELMDAVDSFMKPWRR